MDELLVDELDTFEQFKTFLFRDILVKEKTKEEGHNFIIAVQDKNVRGACERHYFLLDYTDGEKLREACNAIDHCNPEAIPGNYCVEEKFESHQPIQFFLDIEWKEGESYSRNLRERSNGRMYIQYSLKQVHKIIMELGFTKNYNAIVYECCRETDESDGDDGLIYKFSYHIHFENLVVKNVAEATYLMNKIKENECFRGMEWHIVEVDPIDTQVYAHGKFRTAGKKAGGWIENHQKYLLTFYKAYKFEPTSEEPTLLVIKPPLPYPIQNLSDAAKKFTWAPKMQKRMQQRKDSVAFMENALEQEPIDYYDPIIHPYDDLVKEAIQLVYTDEMFADKDLKAVYNFNDFKIWLVHHFLRHQFFKCNKNKGCTLFEKRYTADGEVEWMDQGSMTNAKTLFQTRMHKVKLIDTKEDGSMGTVWSKNFNVATIFAEAPNTPIIYNFTYFPTPFSEEKAKLKRTELYRKQYFNEFRGYRFTPKEAEESIDFSSEDNVDVMKDVFETVIVEYLFKTICDENLDNFYALFAFLSLSFYDPVVYGNSMYLVIFSKVQGTGKSSLIDILTGMVGANNINKAERMSLVKSGFDELQEDRCVYLVIDDVIYSTTKELELLREFFKNRIDSSSYVSRQLYHEAKHNVRKSCSYIFITNYIENVPLPTNGEEQSDRRAFVLEPSNLYLQNHVFFAKLRQVLSQCGDAGYKILMGWFKIHAEHLIRNAEAEHISLEKLPPLFTTAKMDAIRANCVNKSSRIIFDWIYGDVDISGESPVFMKNMRESDVFRHYVTEILQEKDQKCVMILDLVCAMAARYRISLDRVNVVKRYYEEILDNFKKKYANKLPLVKVKIPKKRDRFVTGNSTKSLYQHMNKVWFPCEDGKEKDFSWEIAGFGEVLVFPKNLDLKAALFKGFKKQSLNSVEPIRKFLGRCCNSVFFQNDEDDYVFSVFDIKLNDHFKGTG